MKIDEINDLLEGKVTTSAPIAALRVAQENKSKKLLERVSGVFETILTTSETSIRTYGENIRHYRKALDAERTKLKALDRATQFMNETGNAWPLMKLIGHDRYMLQALREVGVSAPDSDDTGWTVPENWVPAAEAAAT